MAATKKQEPTYPFLPKSTADIAPGQFWAIPLNNGRFACGRVLSLVTGPNGRRHPKRILAGLMDWVGDAPPTFESLAGAKVLDAMEARIGTIAVCGGPLLGCRPLSLDGIDPGLFVAGWEGLHVTQGLVFVRQATDEDRQNLPRLAGLWGNSSIKMIAEDQLGTPVKPLETSPAEEVAACLAAARSHRDLQPETRRFPLTPRTTAQLRPGDYWSIPLTDGRFGCGRVLSLIIDERGKRHTWYFLAGIMDWIGHAPPTAEAIAGRKLASFGEAHLDGILHYGRRILGWRSLDADALQPGLLRAGYDGENLCLGLEFLRKATPSDKERIAECPSWEKRGLAAAAGRLLGTPCAAPVVPDRKKRTRLAFQPSPGLDPRAVQILLDTYWWGGWRNQPTVLPADFAHAREAGLMFDPVVLSHDGIVERLIRARTCLTPAQVADGFLASLSRRRLDLRSALGSYAVFRHMPAHRLDFRDDNPDTPTGKWCEVCSARENPAPQDLNVLNFERFKWGGIRHQDPLYAAFDLERFAEADRPEATPEDAALMRKLLALIRSLPAKALPRDASAALADVMASNKYERDGVIQILGFCGILQSKEVPGYLDSYVPVIEQTAPRGPDNDWRYPVSWWRGRDGINREAVAFWFPGVI